MKSRGKVDPRTLPGQSLAAFVPSAPLVQKTNSWGVQFPGTRKVLSKKNGVNHMMILLPWFRMVKVSPLPLL